MRCLLATAELKIGTIYPLSNTMKTQKEYCYIGITELSLFFKYILNLFESIKKKIFHPFFTTKPIVQGTGLGFLLSYDIIKAYGGVLNVESVEHDGSNFTIVIPNK
ncbi:MAG: ATP-binding protein [Bacteroidales bacterium]|nr:ATP-binding protein [Bacteroidales bacterium]